MKKSVSGLYGSHSSYLPGLLAAGLPVAGLLAAGLLLWPKPPLNLAFLALFFAASLCLVFLFTEGFS